MLFHGAYFSNYLEWLRDPYHVKPSAHLVWSLVGQDILNSDVGGYFQGIYITSGLFQLWRSQGIVSVSQLKASSLVSLIASVVIIGLSFYIMHLWPIATTSRLLSFRSVILLLGLASISWSAHIVHIAAPIEKLLSSGVDPSLIMAPQDLLSRDVMRTIFPLFGKSGLVSLQGIAPTAEYYPVVSTMLNGYTDDSGSIPTFIVGAHHLYLGLVLIILGLLIQPRPRSNSTIIDASSWLLSSWHTQLSIGLLLLATFSFLHSHNIYAAPVYQFLACDYPCQLSLYTHHIWIGGFLMVGCGAHASIALVTDLKPSQTPSLFYKVLAQRDILIGHLIWVVIFLGMHSFGLYIHNDTLQALGRPEDTFSDTSLQLKPIFASILGFASSSSDNDFHAVGTRIISVRSSLGTADFMIQHIHAFTIHTTALILIKGTLYSRSSRLVSDKHRLGFRYPCDGPGRGGTCQISPWDHIFLALFWMYNSLSIVIFHFFWKMQSDVWGSVSTQSSGGIKVSHITSGDFASNATSINGWLRNFLWSQSAQVIQSYSTSISAYSLIFLGSHLIWAFSLMFLYSGRGYWQELIESIVWAHHKVKLVPFIQPRALSISQGRAVGVSHYLLGGIGCTWSFFISRSVALSY
mmetsp:Transcript_4772/g.11849  ORF Transcript_4772/g.11849 Transcript_4772/m.11849 type:complete len:633 (-) Transcript_4772:8-1906(-)